MTVRVEATDPGPIASGVDRIEFYRNGAGAAIVRSPSSPNNYIGTFGVQEGLNRIMVKAVDKVGNESQASLEIAVVLEGKPMPMGPPRARKQTLPR